MQCVIWARTSSAAVAARVKTSTVTINPQPTTFSSPNFLLFWMRLYSSTDVGTRVRTSALILSRCQQGYCAAPGSWDGEELVCRSTVHAVSPPSQSKSVVAAAAAAAHGTFTIQSTPCRDTNVVTQAPAKIWWQTSSMHDVHRNKVRK